MGHKGHRDRDATHNPAQALLATIASALALALATLALPSLASADYEQVPEHFGVSGEAEQLLNSNAIAINATGAGGVEAGSLYAVGNNARVVRFAPGKEGGDSQFREAWGWGAGGFQRCGPAYAPEPRPANTFPTCTPPNPNAPFGGEEVGHFEWLASVAVDQATGNVYVLNTHFGPRKKHLIEAFTATGTPLGEGFADAGTESIAAGPEKLHFMFPTTGALAVDAAGTVYVNDSEYNGVENPQSRVASFEPETPGDYEHYVYAGQAHDIPFVYGEQPARMALVGADRLLGASEEWVRSYALGGDGTPLCNLAVKGQLFAMTANPKTGEVFYFTSADKKIHRFGPCDEETGKFTEIQTAVKPAPTTSAIRALAIDPTLHWGPQRPAGVLYAADREQHGEQLGIGDVLAPAKGAALTLTVTPTGSGSGTVTSSPAGIDCGATCEAQFLEGETVALTAKAAVGSSFAGWSGACTGTGSCEVTMTEAKSVSASFEAEEVVEPGLPLTVAVEGSGSGTVTSDKGLISCQPFCADEYPEGTVVTLSASPGPGSLFMAWKHCDSVNGRQCTVAMSQAKQVQAIFYAAHALTLAKAPGSGPGKVQSSPGGIACLYACTRASALFREGTAVALKATPAKHFHLAQWGGDCSGTGACEVSMGEDHEVSALFAEDPKLSLSLAKQGGGQALVKTKPAGLLCSFTCTAAEASFYEGEALTVTWKLNKGTSRLTWAEGAGTCTGSSEALEGSCTLSLGSATALVAALE